MNRRTFFLAERDRLHFERRAEWSYLSTPPREGYFRLFNKNGARTTFVRPLQQAENRYGWIVQVEPPLDPYFRSVLVEV